MGKKQDAATATATEAVETVEMFSLKSICEELGVNQAGARRKLRSKLAKAEGAGFRWEFTAEQKAEVIAVLTAKAEKKEKAEAEAEAA